MKTIKLIFKILFIISFVFLNSCKKDFLEQVPKGPIVDVTLANKTGVNGLLIGAYSMLDGLGGNVTTDVARAISNWDWGGISSDDAHKGSEYNDQIYAIPIENHSIDATNPYLVGKWSSCYTGAQSANDVIRLLAKVSDGSLTIDETAEIKAEAIFIRTVFLFEAAKVWGNVPYVDENVSFGNNNYNVSNNEPILPKLEADLTWAVEHLNPVQSAVGKANSWAAKALLGKIYMFDQKFTEAKTVLTDVISNGVNPVGIKYDLVNYADNFNPSKQNNAETVFQVQMSVHDGANGANGNTGDALNFPVGGPSTCCGFYQPSLDLGNAFQTDATTGLPLLDTWNENNITTDMGLSSSDPFTPYAGTLDSRIDWTIGRRGIPFLDWGIAPGASWVRAQSQAGPYIDIKSIYYKSAQATTSETWNGWDPNAATSNNYNLIRFADVLLLAAEAEVEVGSLDVAEQYVNRVRSRAANPTGWVHTYIDPNNSTGGFTNTPAANYFVGLYPAGDFLSKGKDYARKAARFERRIELAMEGHRFFDLQRWDKAIPGYMADVLNTYMTKETANWDYHIFTNPRATFTKGKNEIFPIPQSQIDISYENGTATLKQNTGY